MPRVAITDYTFPDLSIERGILEPAGIELASIREKRPADELAGLVRQADAVITQFASLTAGVIESMERARVIVRYGIGYDNVDLEAARRRGIPVCNIPDYCIDEVADHTLALLLALTRQVLPHALRVRDGGWGLATPLTSLHALRHLTVGVVGFGRIGREVVRRLLAFKARVLVFDPVLPPADISRSGAEPAPSLDDLLSRADLVSLHCPSTPETRGLFDAARFSRMKPGALFINASRGDLAVSDALVKALQSGHLGGAALDVFQPEPIPADSPILRMPNVVLSPHIASASPPAVRTLRETAARLALRAVRGESLPNVVNGVPQRAPSTL